jgi:hypothetical protein
MGHTLSSSFESAAPFSHERERRTLLPTVSSAWGGTMQTLEPEQQFGSAGEASPSVRRRRNLLPVVASTVAVLVVTAGIAYAAGSSHAKTTTVVRTVPGPSPVSSKPSAPKAAARGCVPGAAAGSCNVDEASQVAIPDKPLDVATRALLAQQLVAARAAALKYPTVADAQRAGMLQAGKFSPETGAHFISYSGLTTFDPANPASYIYDGISPSSKVIGLMYLSLSTLPPEGFVGPNDHWHRHTNTCVVYKGSQITIPFAADSSVTRAQCDAQHGQFMRETAWMVHAWVVPGWESPLGVFSHSNPDALCADGTTKADAIGFCRGT